MINDTPVSLSNRLNNLKSPIMKNLQIFFVALTLAISLASCKTFSVTDIGRTEDSTTKIPPLEPKFDLKSFGPTYKDLYDLPTAILTGGIDPVGVADNMTQTLTSAEDTKRIYQTCILRNICKSVGDTKGYAVCRMGIRSRGIESWVNPVVSVLTFGIANIFGYNFATYEDNLEIFIDIQDLDRNVVASYSGTGVGKAKSQAYKGYRRRVAKRLAHARAFKEAMKDIQVQIEIDGNEITTILASN